MGRVKSPGLFKRGNIWHIDKQVRNIRVRESTFATNLADAERYLAKRTNEIIEASIYGVRPERLFREAKAKYLQENGHKASIDHDERHLNQLDPFIAYLPLEQVHNGSLQPYVEMRQAQGRKTKSINLALGVVRRILNLAATEWIDDQGLTWLAQAPKIKLLPVRDAKLPYPLSWDEQKRLFAKLPSHLEQMALFKVNTGCRAMEVCRLRWEWEVPIPELKTSVFVLPKQVVKNREERLVVLNTIAKSVVELRRGIHPEYVFTYKGRPMDRMNNSAWRKSRAKAKLPNVRVHDLKHTFGRRLRAAGVSFEDRQDLLGHKSQRITTHYSSAEVSNLIAAANKVCVQEECGAVLTLLKRRINEPPQNPHNGDGAV